MSTETISTARQVVTIHTPRGKFTVGPNGRLGGGLWRVLSRELRTNEQVRAMCTGVGIRGRRGTKPIDRHTLLKWRKDPAVGFPEPVLELGAVELWSRTQVEAWIAARRDARWETPRL